ncbi:hypothetical protein [Clostridium sp.]|jgi:hypothetical protein|uniref:hypothetical protein n=1 Tax=Clostridium sp. TaxID=1506 RepID=UPI003EEFE1D7
MNDIDDVKDDEFVFKDDIYPVPMLNVYSDRSWSNLDQWPQCERNYALLSGTNATAFNVHIRSINFGLTVDNFYFKDNSG